MITDLLVVTLLYVLILAATGLYTYVSVRRHGR